MTNSTKTEPRQSEPVASTSLDGVRVLSALYGLELFGHERGNIEVYKALRRLGATVRVGVNAEEGGGDVGRRLSDLGFETFTLPFHNQWSLQWLKREPLSLPAKFWAVWVCSSIFKAQIASFRPTHVQLGSPLAYSYLALALARSEVPMIYRMGDCPPFDSPFNLRIWRQAMRRTTRLVANAEFVRRSAIAGGVPPERTAVIYALAPSAVDADTHSPSAVLREDGVGERILYVGNLSAHKGIRELIAAFGLIQNRFPRAVLDVVGGSVYDSDFRAEVQRLIGGSGLSGRVLLHGKQLDPTPFYEAATIHVVPSVWEEPMANVVLEAKRQGIPSVVFPSGGLPEVIRHGVDGVICEARTAEALAAGMTWLLDDRERCRSAGREARTSFEDRFGPERFARQWADVFLQTRRGRTQASSGTPPGKT